MERLEKHTNNKKQDYTFWHGYDKEQVDKHPKDGSEGMMIVFIDSDNLKEINTEYDSMYLAFYEVPNGCNNFDDLIRKFRQKFNQPFKGLFGVKTGGLT